MGLRVAVLLLLLVAAAGCFGGAPDAPKPGDQSTGSVTGTSSAPGAAAVGFTWTPQYPQVGHEVTFTGTTSNLDPDAVDAWGWTWGDGNSSTGSPVMTSFDRAGDWTVVVNALLSDGRTLSASKVVFVLGGGESIPNATEDPAPPPPGEFLCDGQPVVEPHETFGTDDALPALSWLTLKTGYRFAVLWSSEQATTGSLTYSVANGTARTVTETVPTRLHMLVIDGLPEHRTLCFTVTMGGVTTPLHAVRTVNGPTGFQPGAPHGTYTLNLLTLVNEQGDLAEVEAGLSDYAKRLWDATDGWVRAGAMPVLVNNFPEHNSGWVTCYIVTTPGLCNQVYDVMFTNDAAPQGAASTYRKGLSDPRAAIWMNQYHQAFPGPLSLDDTGAVLLHEVGHYAFNMDDLYGDPVVPDSQDCDIPSLSMSIMGGSRSSTEFDDEVHPCPTQPSSYTPSWTLLRGEFREIPDRTTDPLKGPDGDGGLFLQRTYRFI